MQGKKQRKRYRRLDRAERAAIQSGLDKAGRAGRWPATWAGRPRRWPTRWPATAPWPRGPGGKGERVRGVPRRRLPQAAVVAALLQRGAGTCATAAARGGGAASTGVWGAGARGRRAARVQDRRRPGRGRVRVRDGADQGDVARGLSPQQIALGRAGQIGASPSTIYRWISRGYAGMCDLDLRRKCGYKPRSRAEPPRATAHGGARSFSAFMGLPEEKRAAACEMDTVIGSRSDRRCLLTLYLRAFRFQLVPGVDARQDGGSTESALDMLERAVAESLRPPVPCS